MPEEREELVASSLRSRFPAATLYVTATVIDPNAKYWDPTKNAFVVGPLASHLFYPIAGQHPDLNLNGIDDFIDIDNGTSKDANGDGVPDEVQACLPERADLLRCQNDIRSANLLEATDKQKKSLLSVAQQRQIQQTEARKCCARPSSRNISRV